MFLLQSERLLFITSLRPKVNKNLASYWFFFFETIQSRMIVHISKSRATCFGWEEIEWNEGGVSCVRVLAKWLGICWRWVTTDKASGWSWCRGCATSFNSWPKASQGETTDNATTFWTAQVIFSVSDKKMQLFQTFLAFIWSRFVWGISIGGRKVLPTARCA